MLKTLQNAGSRRATRLGSAMLPVLLLFTMGTASASPGAIISNQGNVEFTTSSGLSQTFTSNTVNVVTLPSPSTSSLELTRIVGAGAAVYQETVGPAACMQGAGFVPLANPVLTGGGVIDPSMTHNIGLSNSYNLGEPVFVRLTDTDQNFDYQVVEYATVTVTHPASGDSETIQLTETGPDTGIFAGYVQTATGASVAG